MNAKDQMIETVQRESIWLALAKSIVRADAQRLMALKHLTKQGERHAEVQHGQ